MNCTVCNKVMNANLSICPSCGAMRDDDVREEIMNSVIPATKALTIELDEIPEIDEQEIVYEMEQPTTVTDEPVIDIADDFESLDDVILDEEVHEEEPASLPLFDITPEETLKLEIAEEQEPELSLEHLEEDAEIFSLELEDIHEPVSSNESVDETSHVTEIPQTAPKSSRDTSPIEARNTSRLVVDFQNKHSNEPEWKLHVRNRLRGQSSPSDAISEVENSSKVAVLKTGTSDAVASSPLDEETSGLDSARNVVTNSAAPDVLKERALRRIEESRLRYGTGGAPVGATSGSSGLGQTTRTEASVTAVGIDEEEISRLPETAPQERKPTGEISPPGKPKVRIRLVPTPSPAKTTDRLDSYVESVPSSQVDVAEPDTSDAPEKEETTTGSTVTIVPLTVVETPSQDQEYEVNQTDEGPLQPELPDFDDADDEDFEEYEEEYFEEIEEEIEDLAPLGQRFNAGLFDMLICAFAALLLLSPYIVMGGNIMSTTGLLLFFVACGLTTVVYQTLSIGLRGKTFGMRIFALEVIDIEENEYPTFAQAFGNSLVFVASLAFLGLGFISILFNPERRAIHDLVSGTLIVREY